MRSYRIRYVRSSTDGSWRYDVIAVSLDDPDIDDVIASFATVDQAKAYIGDVNMRQSGAGR